MDIAAQVAARHAKLPPFGAPPPGSPIEAWAGMPLGNAVQETASVKLPPFGKLPSPPPPAALNEANTSPPGGPPVVAAARNSPASGPKLAQGDDTETIAVHQTTLAFSALRIGPVPADSTGTQAQLSPCNQPAAPCSHLALPPGPSLTVADSATPLAPVAKAATSMETNEAQSETCPKRWRTDENL